LLCDLRLAFLDRTVQIDVGELVAEVCLHVHQSYQAVLDLQNDIRALADIFEELTNGLDGDIVASAKELVHGEVEARCGDSLQWRVGVYVYVIYAEDIVVVIRLAVGKWVVARNRWMGVAQGLLVETKDR
jgi:hypothetical protein